jgi:hypothetical protein
MSDGFTTCEAVWHLAAFIYFRVPYMQIISGMHRSGTSLMGRLFHEIEADLGAVEHFYPADKWNPEGYFEQQDIYAINTALIHGLWWKFAYFHLPSTETIFRRAAKQALHIQQTAVKYYGKIVKAPHFCLTLNAWLEHGAQISHILVCLREPIHVACSIRKRNLISIDRALELWFLHNQRLLEQINDLPVWFVRYEHILDNELFREEMRAAFCFLGFAVTDNTLEDLYNTCVKPSMNHQQERLFKYSPKIETLWQHLLQRHQAQCEKGTIHAC